MSRPRDTIDLRIRGIIEKVLRVPTAILKKTATGNESTVVLEAARRICNLCVGVQQDGLRRVMVESVKKSRLL